MRARRFELSTAAALSSTALTPMALTPMALTSAALRWTAAVVLAIGAVLGGGSGDGRAATLGQMTEFATPTGASGPEGITAGPDGNLWFVEYLGDKVGEINPTTGAISEFSLPTASAGPAGIAWGPDGNVWFTEFLAGKIGEINPTTHAITEFTTPTANSGPVAITTGSDGNVWFTEGAASKIGEVNPATHVIDEYRTKTASSGPFGITTGPDGNIWFTEKTADRIGELSPSQPLATVDYPIPTASSQPNEIVTGPDDSLWFTESANGVSRIGELSPAAPATIVDYPLTSTSAQPAVIVAGPDGNMWFTESGASAIGEFNPVTHAVINTYPTTTSASDPIGIAVGEDGNLWFTEGIASKIGVVGSGSPAAATSAAAVTGTAQQGSKVTCQPPAWATWAGFAPSLTAYLFDGYQWLRGGNPIAGATAQTYTPSSADVGQQLACQVTATYALQSSTALTTSPAVTVSPPLADSLGRTVVSGKTVSQVITCQGAPGELCHGPVTLTAEVTTRGRSTIAVSALLRTAAKSKSRSIRKTPPKVTKKETVAAGSYSVGAGQSGTVKVTLNRAGAALLSRFYRLPATLTLGGATPLITAITFNYPVIHAQISYTWAFSRSFTVAQQLSVSKIPAGGSVDAICHGNGCPFSHKRWSARHGRASLTPSFKNAHLAPGATLELEITARQQVGQVAEFTVRSGQLPTARELCLPPGAARPQKCA